MSVPEGLFISEDGNFNFVTCNGLNVIQDLTLPIVPTTPTGSTYVDRGQIVLVSGSDEVMFFNGSTWVPLGDSGGVGFNITGGTNSAYGPSTNAGLSSTGNDNTFVGMNSGNANTTGEANTFSDTTRGRPILPQSAMCL